jgi:hypothetical protein
MGGRESGITKPVRHSCILNWLPQPVCLIFPAHIWTRGLLRWGTLVLFPRAQNPGQGGQGTQLPTQAPQPPTPDLGSVPSLPELVSLIEGQWLDRPRALSPSPR